MNHLGLRTVLALLRMPLGLGLLIFLPARTWAWWQGWVYAVIIMIMVFISTGYLWFHDRPLLARRLRAGPFAEKDWGQKLIILPALIFMIMIFVVAGCDHRFHAATLPAWLEIAADILVALGFYITHLTLRENSHAAGTIRVEEGQTVTSTGPYAWVRHPMYAGASLLLLATPVALGSVRALVPAVIVVVLIALRLLREERFLKANLPGYEDYCRKVRWRLVPGLW